MDHWLLALGPGAAQVFNGPDQPVETPKPDLYPLYIDQLSCFITSKILFLWSEFLPFGIFCNESKD